jgi:ribosomal protein S27E
MGLTVAIPAVFPSSCKAGQSGKSDRHVTRSLSGEIKLIFLSLMIMIGSRKRHHMPIRQESGPIERSKERKKEGEMSSNPVLVKCIDCGETRTIELHRKEVPVRCPSCARKHKNKQIRQGRYF